MCVKSPIYYNSVSAYSAACLSPVSFLRDLEEKEFGNFLIFDVYYRWRGGGGRRTSGIIRGCFCLFSPA